MEKILLEYYKVEGTNILDYTEILEYCFTGEPQARNFAKLNDELETACLYKITLTEEDGRVYQTEEKIGMIPCKRVLDEIEEINHEIQETEEEIEWLKQHTNEHDFDAGACYQLAEAKAWLAKLKAQLALYDFV